MGGHFWGGELKDILLLMGCGVITSAPIMLFVNGAKLLRLSTIGILQYLAPSMIFLIAIFVFKEEFDLISFVSFSIIWISLLIYSLGILFVKK